MQQLGQFECAFVCPHENTPGKNLQVLAERVTKLNTMCLKVESTCSDVFL